MRYIDLTSSELSYLHDLGSEDAAQALVERARRGDPEAISYLRSDMMGSHVVLGDAAPITTADFLTPHKLIDRALAANVDPNTLRLRGPAIVRAVARPGAKPIPTRPRLVVGPPPRKTSQWGVFVDYAQEPDEVFDTLVQANAWAATIPQGVFFAVIHAGQEPPRPPYGYQATSNVESPITYEDVNAQQAGGVRAPSAYEAYQLQQGQRV